MNRFLKSEFLYKAIISVIVVGLIASLFLISERINWEQTSKQVELVMDYDDMRILFDFTGNPEQTEKDFLNSIKNKVNSIAVYEETLASLKTEGGLSNTIQVYSGRELSERLGEKNVEGKIEPNHTYVLFQDELAKNTWSSLFQTFLSKEGEVRTVSFNGQDGIEIAAPYRLLKDKSLGLDPRLIQKLKGNGFDIVPRISNSYKDRERTIALVKQVAAFNPTYIIFQGEDVTGNPSFLKEVANILYEKKIGIGFVEIAKEQAGIKKLGFDLAHIGQEKNDENWLITRVHSLSEFSIGKLVRPSTEQLNGKEPAVFKELQELAELAITERNIRLVYLHAPMPYIKHIPFDELDTVDLKQENPSDILKKTSLAIDDMSSRILQEGYSLGKAETFKYTEKGWMAIARWLALLAGIGVISLLASLYIEGIYISMITFSLGVLGMITAKVLGLDSLYFKIIGLGTAVSAPVLAIGFSIKQIKDLVGKKYSLVHTLKVYFGAALISLLGALLVVGMFSHIKYSLYLDQFRGVTVLYLAPLLLAFVLIMLAYNEPVMKFLRGSFKNYYVIILGVLGIGVLYYLSRSGNEAEIAGVEIKFRQFLQTFLDVRPRTKEFLIAYPLFIFAIYLSYKYKRAAYLLVAAAMGQLSIVSTFTHLHTPFLVSVIRTIYGLGIGLLLGFLLVLIWKIIEPLFLSLIRRLGL